MSIYTHMCELKRRRNSAIFRARKCNFDEREGFPQSTLMRGRNVCSFECTHVASSAVIRRHVAGWRGVRRVEESQPPFLRNTIQQIYTRRLRNRAHAALRRAMASRARQTTRLLPKTGDACSKSAAGMRDDVRGRCDPRDGTSTLGLVHIKRAIASMLLRHRRPPARRRGDTNGWPLLCS